MYPRDFAISSPLKPAVIVESSGVTLSFAELEARANQVAHAFRSLGFRPGDKVAFILENCAEVFPFAWGAQRSGLYFIAISTRLGAGEIEYIVQDSGSKLLLASDYVAAETLDEATAQIPDLKRYKLDLSSQDTGTWHSWKDFIDQQPETPIDDECRGNDMLYSSGTTGRPKGILSKVDHNDAPDAENPSVLLARDAFGFSDETSYLCPAPLYHAAPLRWSMWTHILGGTVVVMEKFDAEASLALIEKHGVTHAQFVPTHFVRMLKADEELRSRFDLSSLKVALHAAAPCPVPIKQEMIEWWGPILYEYYAGSEGNGMTMISSEEWLSHPGSVGRAVVGELKICDHEGDEVAVGEEGGIYFAGGRDFEYHNDPDKTREATNKHGWTSLGDIGRVDEEGFLYLTDRKGFMIISGGVNIYPQEVENLLITHPRIADVAVIGAPDPDFGEKVVAVVQPKSMNDASDEFAAELDAFCRASLSPIKCPRQIDFRQELPRADTGKLYKRLIRDEYWEASK